MSVHIDKIRIDGGTQARACLNEQTVAEYAEAMEDPNTVFPPVVVYFDGREYWLADGFHRLAAWRQIGRTDIPADVRQGDRRRAILHSVAANSAHGLRRTNEDKRRAVLTLLEDEEWSSWSDREIARKCAVSPSFVGALRGASVHGGQIAETRTVQRNGTTYQQNIAKIGEKPRPRVEPIELIEDEPPAKAAPVIDDDPVEYLARLMLHATDDWGRLASALYQVSTAEIREFVLEAIAENEANDGHL
ncbi:ParB N-terminal domain-containing protein [Paracoccus denitrificans]|uniref:ParB N-terminal domain-containing protein n=1 Tax=Paracoccus denitrificans TaxID=266 RepID=UPI003364F216